MSPSEEFVSFEKALRELKMRSEELKKLVSEGEIRAFRDGDSMKFRKEDIVALTSKSTGEEELAFADALEDDTGMVTEQLSAEDTLIEEDLEAAQPARKNNGARRAPVMAAAETGGKEPGWVTALGIIGFLLLVWGFMINYSISQQGDPADHLFTSSWAQAKK